MKTESIIQGLIDAAREARIRDIKANAVIISDRLYFSKLVGPLSGREQPMICGLRAFYDPVMPADTLFAVLYSDDLPQTKDEQISVLKAENAELRKQIALIREVLGHGET